MYILYDIACLQETHQKRKERTDLLDAVKLAISIFHCYGHKMACQVLYNPRRTPGLGLTDGECLGKFKSISKEMTPENRVDLLVNGLMHYGDNMKRKQGKTFAERLKKSNTLKVNTTKMLQENLGNISGVSTDDIRRWSMEEKQRFSTGNSLARIESKEPLTPLGTYAIILKKYYHLSPGYEKTDGRENLLTADDEEICTWTSCCSKTWETAKKVNTAVQHHLKEYNLLEGSKMPYPDKLDLDSLKSLEVPASVPEELQRLLINLYETKDRCEEEIELIACDMRSTNCFYMKQQEAVLSSFESAESDVHKAVLLLEGLNTERCILHQRNMSSNVSIVNEVPLHFHKKLQLDLPIVEQEILSILGNLVSDEYLLEQSDVEGSESMDSYPSSDEADDIEMGT
ncbi:hypothetical protein CHS0354_041413 [Potamilus streckersoni]|uniref:Uncharacterized protein n=1 Tax=Potamilus streckersoni TaxID=2493646 RepID=A0AAE0W9K3_9BIVA|nr:hypothetical protein CHS0354_041413 [Potamilus streckersoni]